MQQFAGMEGPPKNGLINYLSSEMISLTDLHRVSSNRIGHVTCLEKKEQGADHHSLPPIETSSKPPNSPESTCTTRTSSLQNTK